MAKINWNALTAAQRKQVTKQRIETKQATAAKNKTSAKKSNEARSEKTSAQQLEESRQYVAAKQEKQTGLLNKLEAGGYKSPTAKMSPSAEEETLPQTAVTTNTSYHDALHDIITDLGSRIGTIQEGSKNQAELVLNKKAEVAGLKSRDDLRTKTGRRIGLSAVPSRTQTLKKLATPSYLLQQATEHLRNSAAANKAGDVFTAGESFSKAGDAIVSLLKHADTNFSRINPKGQKIYHEKYGTVFSDPSYGDPENELRVHAGTHEDVQTIVNGFANHIIEKGKQSQRIQNDDVAKGLKTDLSRDYSLTTKKGQERADEERTPSVELPAAYQVKTEAEKAAAVTARETRRINNKKEKAQQTGRTFAAAPSLESDTAPEDSVSSYTTPSLSATTTGHFGDFQLRWKRAQVQQRFDAEEKRNAASAKQAGQTYTPKTFTGSSAWENPDKWHAENVLKQHWLKSSKANTPENFDSSDAKLDPSGYIKKAKESGNPVNITLEPTREQYESWARQTAVSPKGTDFEAKLFPKVEGEKKSDELTGTTLLPFMPNRREEKNATELNEESVPADVNARQIARSRKQAFGMGLGSHSEPIKDETTGEVIGAKTVRITDQEPTTPVVENSSDKELLSGEAEPTGSNTVEDAATTENVRSRSLNTFFNDGGAK